MITYSKLCEKFIDKGMIMELHWLVTPPPTFIPDRLINNSLDNSNKIVQEVYGEQWDYWNTWIDYQKHK